MLGKSHLANLGMRIIPMESGTHSFGRISGFPSFSWLAAGATQGDQTVTFDAVSLSAKTLRSWAKVTREFLQDAVNPEQVLRTAFSASGGAEIDRAGLEGSGTGQEPAGIATMSSVSSFSMGTNGAAFTNYDSFIDATAAIYASNGPTPNAAMMHPTRWGNPFKAERSNYQRTSATTCRS
jgi:HK97 family phage major capsid protein